MLVTRPTRVPPTAATGRRRRAAAVRPSGAAAGARGASGLDIGGSRPTSPKAWEAIKRTLKANRVTVRERGERVAGGPSGRRRRRSPTPAPTPPSQFISPQELVLAQARGVPILDVRPPGEHASGRVPGAASVPLYRPITGLSPRAVARRAVFAFFGVLNGTEANPGFGDAALAALADAKNSRRGALAPFLQLRPTAVLYCNIGGVVDETATNKAGTQSRSLTAAYELAALGITDVAVLKDGMSGWVRTGREVEEG